MELQAEAAKFRAAGAELVALAYQDAARAQLMAQLVPATFPILADADHAVSAAYGVFDLLGDGLTTPAVFVVDRRGSIVWSYIGKSAVDRPAPAEILAHVPK